MWYVGFETYVETGFKVHELNSAYANLESILFLKLRYSYISRFKIWIESWFANVRYSNLVSVVRSFEFIYVFLHILCENWCFFYLHPKMVSSIPIASKKLPWLLVYNLWSVPPQRVKAVENMNLNHLVFLFIYFQNLVESRMYCINYYLLFLWKA